MAENGLGHLVIHEKVDAGGYDNDAFTQHNTDELKRPKGVENEEMQEVTSENGHLPSSPTKISLTNGYGRHSPDPPSPTLTNGSAMVVVNCEVAEGDTKSASHRNSTSSSNQEDDNVNLNVDTSKELKCPLDTKLHHYVSVDEGKMLNSGENTRINIDIPDDAVINFNTGRIRVQNQQNKNHNPLPKVCHEKDEEKIPMQDMSCSLASLQEDSEKALEAAQNGRSSDEYSTDTATNEKQGNGGGAFDEYFIPVNTHKKYLRGEKLYLTKDSEKLCKNWRRVIVCGLISIVIAVAILVGVLAATGILLAESEGKNTRHEVKDNHVNDLASVALAGSHLGRPPKLPPTKFQPQTTAEIPQVTTIASQSVSQPLIPIVPLTQPDLSQSNNVVPNALVGEFTIVDENFTNDLSDPTSYGYLSMATHVEDELSRVFKENRGNFQEVKILQFRPGSIIVKFVVVWKNERGVIPAKKANQIMKTYFKDHGNRFLAFQVNRNSLNFVDVIDECRDKKGGCSHVCKWNYLNSTKMCICEDDMELSEDGKNCVVKTQTAKSVSEIPDTPTTILISEVPMTTVTPISLLGETTSSKRPSEDDIDVSTPLSVINSTPADKGDGSESKTESVTNQNGDSAATPETTTKNSLVLIGADSNQTTVATTPDTNKVTEVPMFSSNETIFNTTIVTEFPDQTTVIYKMLSTFADHIRDEKNATTTIENELDTVIPFGVTEITEAVVVTTPSPPIESKTSDGNVDMTKDEQFNHQSSFAPSTISPIPVTQSKNVDVIPLVISVASTDDNSTNLDDNISSSDMNPFPMDTTTWLLEGIPQGGSTTSTSDVSNLDEVTTSFGTNDASLPSEILVVKNSDPSTISPLLVTSVSNETSNVTLEDSQNTPQEAVSPVVDELVLITTSDLVTEASIFEIPLNETITVIDTNPELSSLSIALTKAEEPNTPITPTIEAAITDNPNPTSEEGLDFVTSDSIAAAAVNSTIEELFPSANSTEKSVEENDVTTWSYITSLFNLTTITGLFSSSTEQPTSSTPMDDLIPNKFNRTPAYRLFDNISDSIHTEPPHLINVTPSDILVSMDSTNQSKEETTVMPIMPPALFENVTELSGNIGTSDDTSSSIASVEIDATTKIDNGEEKKEEFFTDLNNLEIGTQQPEETVSPDEGNEAESPSRVHDLVTMAGITESPSTIGPTESSVTLKEVLEPVNSDNIENHSSDEIPTLLEPDLYNETAVLSLTNETAELTNTNETSVSEINTTGISVNENQGFNNEAKNMSDSVDKADSPTDEMSVDSNVTDVDNLPKVTDDEKNDYDTVTKNDVVSDNINTTETTIVSDVMEMPVTSSEIPVASTETPFTLDETIFTLSIQQPTEPTSAKDIPDTSGYIETGVIDQDGKLSTTLSGKEEPLFVKETELRVTSSENVSINESGSTSGIITGSETTTPSTFETALIDSILKNENNTETTIDNPLTTDQSEAIQTTLSMIEDIDSTSTPLTPSMETTGNTSLIESETASDSLPYTVEFMEFNLTDVITSPTTFELDFVEAATATPMTMAAFEVNATTENLTTLDFMAKLSTHEDYEMFNTTLNDTVTDVTEGIVCRDDQFLCISLNVCLNNTFICDGIEDCPGGVDENDCVETCNLNFKCANSSICIMSEAQCDGVWDCDDGSDEQNCTPTECAKHEVMCLDGSTCIKPNHICDWKYNCRDRSDEVGCVERTTCETGGRFFCNDGLCIPWSLKCDGAYDCKEKEDEGNCTCLEDEFKCNDGKCLKSSSRCDGHKDCIDYEDEMGCVNVDSQGIVSAFEPYSGSWSLICSDDWNLDDGHYLCQELGFGHALTTEKNHVSFNGTWMAMKRDNLTAASLWTERVTFAESCSSNLAASVMCQQFDCGNYSGLLHRRRKRQSDGLSSPNTQWPFIAYVSTFQSTKGCLSEILTPVWLVTSAECLLSIGKEPHNGSDWYVRTNIATGFDSEQAQNHEVLKIIPHPHSSKFRSLILRDYDVALVRLKHSLVFSEKIGAICLPEEQVPSGITCFSGVLGSEKPRAPPPKTPTISSLALMVMDKDTCNTPEQYNNQINNRMLCTKSSEAQRICDNDEGTPLMCLSQPNKWYLAGMLTYQRFCGVYNWHPAVFSNLFAVRNFIDQVTSQKQYGTHYDSNMYVIMPPTTIGPTEGTTDLTPTMGMDFETTMTTPSEVLFHAVRLNDHELYSERHEEGEGDGDYNSTDTSTPFNMTYDYFMYDNSTGLESLLGIELAGENKTVFISTTLGNMTVDDDHTMMPELLPLNGTQKLLALKHPVESDYDSDENSTDNSLDNDTTTAFSISTLLYKPTMIPFALDISNNSFGSSDSKAEDNAVETVATTVATVHEESNITETMPDPIDELPLINPTMQPMPVNDAATNPVMVDTISASAERESLISELSPNDNVTANAELSNKTFDSVNGNMSSETNNMSARMLPDINSSTLTVDNHKTTEAIPIGKELIIKFDNETALLSSADSDTYKLDPVSNDTRDAHKSDDIVVSNTSLSSTLSGNEGEVESIMHGNEENSSMLVEAGTSNTSISVEPKASNASIPVVAETSNTSILEEAKVSNTSIPGEVEALNVSISGEEEGLNVSIAVEAEALTTSPQPVMQDFNTNTTAFDILATTVTGDIANSDTTSAKDTSINDTVSTEN